MSYCTWTWERVQSVVRRLATSLGGSAGPLSAVSAVVPRIKIPGSRLRSHSVGWSTLRGESRQNGMNTLQIDSEMTFEHSRMSPSK